MSFTSSNRQGRQLRYVSRTEIRRIFNNNEYHEKVQSGEFTRELLADRHLRRRRPSGDPFCTRSQKYAYKDGDKYVATVHQYLRPDGTLGASGLPDPKRLYFDTYILAIRASRRD